MPIPADDLARTLTLGNADSNPHIGIVGDTYTLLLTGADTAGRFCLIDMHIPPGGGPPPHRHDFEETFSLISERARRHLPRPDHYNPRRPNHPHPRQRSAPVPQCQRRTRPHALHLLARRSGEHVPRTGRSRGHPHHITAAALRRRSVRLHGKSQIPRRKVPHGALATRIAIFDARNLTDDNNYRLLTPDADTSQRRDPALP